MFREINLKVDELVGNLLIAFGELLDEVDWMEQSAKLEAKAKVGILRKFMGFPEWLENKTSVEEFYDGVRLN